MAKVSYKTTVEVFKKEQGIVPFTEQSPEQREEFVGRVKCLNVTNINLQLLLDNWAYVASAIPDKKESPKLHSLFKQVSTSLSETIAASKMLNSRLLHLLSSGEQGKENLETFSWYNKEIISFLLRIPQDRIQIAIDFLNQLASGDGIQAESEEDYEKNMVDFGNYCIELATKGRKKATKKDFKKFNENKNGNK